MMVLPDLCTVALFVDRSADVMVHTRFVHRCTFRGPMTFGGGGFALSV